jgi:DNA-binding MarR family transcriptional regulator
MGRMAANESETIAVERNACELLELFYPIHYKGSMAVEDAMRGELTRKQAAILWLIRSAGTENGRCMRRKEIVLRLQDWFDVSSPAITQALRGMARPPLSLVRLLEDSASAREKRVLLTAKGERFISTMAQRGRVFLQQVTEQLAEHQLRSGIEFLRAGVAAFERVNLQNYINDKRPAQMRRKGSRRFPTARAENNCDVAPSCDKI